MSNKESNDVHTDSDLFKRSVKTAEKNISDRAATMVIDKIILTELWKYKLFKLIMTGFVAMAIWSVVSMILVFAAFAMHDQPYPIGIDSHGKIVRLTPLNSINAPASVIGKKTSEFLTATFTFDYVHWKDQLNEASNLYFTSHGKSSFRNQMIKPDGLLQFVRDNNAITTATSRGVATLMNMGVTKNDGVFTYQFKIYITVDFKGANGSRGLRHFEVITFVKRVPISEYEYGIAINSLSMKPIGKLS